MAALTGFLKRHPLIAYFMLTYALSWGLWIGFQGLVKAGQTYLMVLISLGVFAPALVSLGLSALLAPASRPGSRKPALVVFFVAWVLASTIITAYMLVNDRRPFSVLLLTVCAISALLPALVVSAAFSRLPAVRAHLGTLIRPKGAWGYYLLALVLFPAFWLLGTLLSRALGMQMPVSSYPSLNAGLVGMVLLFFLYNVIYGGLSEEPGWRGFALPRLQARFSPLVSSLILGVLWAGWHAPARFGGLQAKSLPDTLVEWILIVLVTVIFTWLFNRTHGSILVTVLVHPAMNTTGSFLTGSPGAILLLFAFMVFVIIYDKMWRRLPPDSPGVYRPQAQSA